MYTGEQSDYIGRGFNLTKIFETILSSSVDLLLAFPIVGHLEISNKAQFSWIILNCINPWMQATGSNPTPRANSITALKFVIFKIVFD